MTVKRSYVKTRGTVATVRLSVNSTAYVDDITAARDLLKTDVQSIRDSGVEVRRCDADASVRVIFGRMTVMMEIEVGADDAASLGGGDR